MQNKLIEKILKASKVISQQQRNGIGTYIFVSSRMEINELRKDKIKKILLALDEKM